MLLIFFFFTLNFFFYLIFSITLTVFCTTPCTACLGGFDNNKMALSSSSSSSFFSGVTSIRHFRDVNPSPTGRYGVGLRAPTWTLQRRRPRTEASLACPDSSPPAAFQKKRERRKWWSVTLKEMDRGGRSCCCLMWGEGECDFYLQDGKVLENAVHHVLFGQVLELVDKVDHVFAHGRPVDAVDEAAVLEAGVFRFHLLHDLFAERAHFGRTRDCHVLVAFVPSNWGASWIN